MKHLLTLLLIVFLLAGCGRSAGYAVKKIGYRLGQCCTSLPFSKTNTPLALHPTEPGSGNGSVSIFEQEMQLIHTW